MDHTVRSGFGKIAEPAGDRQRERRLLRLQRSEAISVFVAGGSVILLSFKQAGCATGNAAAIHINRPLQQLSDHTRSCFRVDRRGFLCRSATQRAGDAKKLKGKKVIVGGTALELGDRFGVPNGAVVRGLWLQAPAAESILANLLAGMGCPEGQEYHFGRRMPAAEFEQKFLEHLANQSAAPAEQPRVRLEPA